MRRWYVATFHHGYYKKLCHTYELYKDTIFKNIQMWYPMVRVVKVKKMQKVIEKEPLFPGYVLFKIDEHSDLWNKIKKVTPIFDFLRNENGELIPLTPSEIRQIIELSNKKIETNYEHLVGSKVLIIKGPFKGFIGECKFISTQTNTAKCYIDIFGEFSRLVDISLEYIEEIL